VVSVTKGAIWSSQVKVGFQDLKNKILFLSYLMNFKVYMKFHILFFKQKQVDRDSI
jgi:hypothetical protein